MHDLSMCSRGKCEVVSGHIMRCDGFFIGAALFVGSYTQTQQNAELWADATNTLTKTGKAASQLADELESARETIKHMADELRRLKPGRHNEQEILDSVCSQD